MEEFLRDYVRDNMECREIKLTKAKEDEIVYALCSDDDIWQLVDCKISDML